MPPREAEDTENGKEGARSWLYLGIAVAIMLVVFFSLFFLFRAKQEPPKTIEELHALNLQGKLKPDQGYIYNGFSFVQANGLWFTQIRSGNKQFSVPLHYGPRNLSDVAIEGKLSPDFGYSDSFTMTFDPDDPQLGYVTLAWGELGVTLTQAFNVRLKQACTKPDDGGCSNITIGGCDLNTSVFYFRTAPEPRVLLQGNCAIIEGNQKGLVKAADRFALVLYGVMLP
ncbi:MAG: hypothetical protein V1735_02895 [Nanoarchaeota archaeon]